MNNHPFIRGRWVNLEGRRIGHFIVSSIYLSSRSGAPTWKVICDGCGAEFVRPHAQLTAALESDKPDETLRCENAACKFAIQVHSAEESLRDVRRQERQQREKEQRDADVRQAAAAEQAANAAANAVAIRAERDRWNVYVNALINAGIPLRDILSYDRWMRQGMDWQDEALARIAS